LALGSIFLRSNLSMRRYHPLFFSLLGLGGCLTTSHGLRLYEGDQDLPRERVARLVGPITRVDGRVVPTDVDSYLLLPGCHVVQIGGAVGKTSPSPSSGYAANLPALTYAMPMRPGYSYVIEIEREPTLGVMAVGRGRIVARETDREGNERPLPIASGPADVEECLRLEGPSGSPRWSRH
jgi:hypothetical protein